MKYARLCLYYTYIVSVYTLQGTIVPITGAGDRAICSYISNKAPCSGNRGGMDLEVRPLIGYLGRMWGDSECLMDIDQAENGLIVILDHTTQLKLSVVHQNST